MVRQAESKFQGDARFLLTRIFWQGCYHSCQYDENLKSQLMLDGSNDNHAPLIFACVKGYDVKGKIASGQHNWQSFGKMNLKISSFGELLYRLIIAALTRRVSVLYLPIMLTNENDLRRRWDI